ncbi:MAG: dUTP diphosphatase [Candidatus Borkfalkiaceae bacterium]|nr:dUTP diphosphatase [Christensenellaceae bacterium]MDY5819804.1 dUTP diphosphatase [Christensenellaceae bacterium]
MKVRIKKLNERAVIPTYGSAGSAGGDLYSAEENDITVASGQTAFIGTGLAVEIPQGLVGLVYARSGLACKKGLAPANKVGVIDSDYRGEIKVALYNHGKEPQTVAKGERIAQLVIAPFVFAEYEETDDLSDTARGEGGFGSTGRK